MAVNQWIRSLSVTLINTYRHLCPTLEKNLNMAVSDDQLKKEKKKTAIHAPHVSTNNVFRAIVTAQIYHTYAVKCNLMLTRM